MEGQGCGRNAQSFLHHARGQSPRSRNDEGSEYLQTNGMPQRNQCLNDGLLFHLCDYTSRLVVFDVNAVSGMRRALNDLPHFRQLDVRQNLKMHQGPAIRRVKPEDFERVASHACYREDDAPRRLAYAAWVKRRIEMGTYIGRFSVEGDSVASGVGALLLDWGPTRANPSGTMARIVNVYTEPPWRRQGIAKRLLEALMTDCEQRGIREFNLGSTPEARALYERLGFQLYPAEMRRRVSDNC